MRTITEEFQVYTWESATPEIREKIRYYFDSDGFHGEHMLQERIDTLKGLAKALGGRLDYSLSCVPDRGEYITIKPKYDSLDFDALHGLADKDCPFTGCCYDNDLLEDIAEAKTDCDVEALNTALNKYVDAIHAEYEDMLRDEYLADHCASNGYEFKENGNMY